jgi:hypothetical protein
LTQKEIDERPPLAVIEYRETIAFALRRLTGRQLPPVGQAWRDALDLPAPKVPAK